MTKVKIRNFQSIKDTEFEINGFTVIVGRNNTGKSAVVRAVDAALSNRAGTEFIRNGEKQCEVGIEREGLDIKWKKGSSSSYLVNGESFTKLNRAVPKTIQDAGFRKLEIDDLKLNPLLAPQFFELFLLDESGSTVTNALSSIYNLDTISIADDLCQKQLRSVKNLLGTREEDLSAVDHDIEKYKDIDSLKQKMERVAQIQKQVDAIQKQIAEIDTITQQFTQFTAAVEHLKKVNDVVIPDARKAAQNFKDYVWVTSKAQEHTALSNSVKTLSNISQVNVPDTGTAVGFIENMKEISNLSDSLKQFARAVKSLKTGIDKIQAPVANMATLADAATPLIDEVVRVRELEGDFRQTAINAKALREDLRKTEQEITEAEQEKAKIDVCPLCRRPL